MQQAFAFISRFAPLVTSVMHGHHEGATTGPNEDPHYAGRAIDVGAFGGTPVGFNPPTWQAVMNAIASRRFQAIGTIPEIASNPQAQAWAKANGVNLFTDVGSGPHVHLQVGAS